MSSVGGPYNNGTLFYANGYSYVSCSGCGQLVEHAKWYIHCELHAMWTVSAATAPVGFNSDDVLARLRRLEDYMFTDKEKMLDEIGAIRSIIESVRDPKAA